MTQFTDLNLAPALLRALNDEGYKEPTPIQSELIPHALDKHDIVGIAQTGTGKTAAFTLPLLHHIHGSNAALKRKTPKALILAPTRELVLQITASVRTYGRHIRPSIVEIVGGVKPGPQIRAMAPGCDVLVATPGRLLDHINAGAIRLDGTSFVVLDEADHMFDMGFLPQIRRIMSALPKARQTLLLSATMPKAIRTLADDFLSDPVSVQVAAQSRPVERIEQRLIHTPGEEKRDRLVEILTQPDVERAVVFTRTKRGADRVTKALRTAGIEADAIHGNKTQGQRLRALDSFKRGKVLALVATDVAARGIDIDGVSHVINYELPNVPESYVHRIGRTARAGRDGIAISFCEGEERSWLRAIEKLIGMEIPATGEIQKEMPPPIPGRGRQQPRPKQQRAKKPRTSAGQPRSASPEGQKTSAGGAGKPKQRSRPASATASATAKPGGKPKHKKKAHGRPAANGTRSGTARTSPKGKPGQKKRHRPAGGQRQSA